jgi:predicted Rossmann fold nucleotide-binding protein DprA/Smf involved in DNA uptake
MTQATLLLCAHFVAAKAKEVPPLSLGEFNELIAALERSNFLPADLLEPDRSELILETLHPQFDMSQLRNLLKRGFALSLSLEKWASYGIWIASRDDERYPARLRQRLGPLAPALLYGCGDPALLEAGGVAIVGSRDVDEAAVVFTQELATACARDRMTVVSGGARGVDQFAMLAASQAEGRVVGVMADSLARSSTAANARDAIREGQVTLVSPFDPEAGFNVGNAMSRNKAIYALADYGVVVSSSYKEGGTWSGAIEQLERFKQVPIFVRSGDSMPEGNKQLLKAGGLAVPPQPWTEGLKNELVRAVQASSYKDRFIQPSLL